MNHTKTRLTLGALTATLCLSATAQQSNQTPEQIVVVANRIPVPTKQIAQSISIIDAQALQDHGNISLTEVLRQTAAIGGSKYGGTGAISQIRIRGEEGFRTLTLFDGMRLSDPSAPQVGTPVEHLLSGGIGRVEILRGPQGLSYGADAGGVVSISSLASTPGLQINLDGQAGSFGTEQVAATVSAANESADFFLTASDYQSDGYNVRLSDTVVADKDGYENQTYHARLGFNVSESLRLELVHREVDGSTQYDGCFSGTTVYDCEASYELDATRVAATYTGSNISHSLAYSNSNTDRDDFALGVLAFGSAGELERWEYVGSARQLPGVDLVFGIDLEKEQNGDLRRDNEGYYIEALSDFSDRFFVTAGLREDRNDDFGDHRSYRISAAYLIPIASGEIKLKSSLGTGFRSPSLFEIDYNRGAFAFPPASLTHLSEESSEGFEYGLEYQSHNGLHLELVRFDQDVEDAIYFDLAGFSGYLQDIGSSQSSGVELIAAMPVTEQLSLSANYTYNDTERPNGQQRLRRPEHLANFGVNYRSSSQRLNLHAYYRMTRDAIDEYSGQIVALEDSSVLDLSASYRISETIQLYGRIENLLDDDFQEVVDFHAPGRASYVGIRVNF